MNQLPAQTLHWQTNLSASARHAALAAWLERHGAKRQGDPDVYFLSAPEWGIEESRSLIRHAATAPLGERKFLIADLQTITIPAQDALLKLFEEPPPNVFLLFITPPGLSLRPTLRSRLYPISLSEEEVEVAAAEAEAFLATSYSARLKEVATLYKKKDLPGVRRLLRSLLSFLTTLPPEIRAAHAQTLTRIHHLITDQLASSAIHKPTLEAIVLLTPPLERLSSSTKIKRSDFKGS